MLEPSVSLSAFSGASDSLNSARASRPVRISAPGFEAEPRVAGAVAEDLRVDAVQVLGLVAAGAHLVDAAVLHVAEYSDGFEQQRDVGLADHLVVEQQVPQLPAALVGCWRRRRAATLRSGRPRASPGGRVWLVGADDVHLDLARGVAAQPRAVLKQHHLGAVPGRGDRGANTREASTGDKTYPRRNRPASYAAQRGGQPFGRHLVERAHPSCA